MSQHSDPERQAGTLILSQLKMFNEAVVYFEQHLSPAFFKSMDRCIDRFVKDNNWVGKINYEQKGYFWLAHPDWVIEGENCKCWFADYVTVSEGNDFLLAVLTGTGTEKGKFGFELKINHGYFGNAKNIASHVSNAPELYRSELRGLGFVEQDKGGYFYPVTIDQTLLKACWLDNGSFPVEHELFSPLRMALKAVLQSTKIINAIFIPEVSNTN